MRSDVNRCSRRVGWLVALATLVVGGSVHADDDATDRVTLVGTVVDEAGKPVAGAKVSGEAWGPIAPVTTGVDGAFRLSLPTNQASRVLAAIVARAGDGRVGAKMELFEVSKPEPVSIVVKPTRPLEVRVVDGTGRPVADAEVHVLFSFRQVASGRTDGTGRWATRVPADLMTAWHVYALKSKIGFDYAQAERARGSAEPPLPLPENLTLTLDGARPPLRIKAVDRDGKPLPGIQVGPWLIQKPGHESQMNGIHDAFRETDATGVASFDWLPTHHQGKLSIISRPSKAYYPPDHATWIDADRPVDEVSLTFYPLQGLSGRVTTADGRPAVGATVRARGQGSRQNGYDGEARTGADGRFRLNVYSEQAYIITASKDDLAAPCRSGVVVRAGKPVEGVDLVLGPGTRLRGRVTVGKEHKPIAQAYVTTMIDGGVMPPELKLDGGRSDHLMVRLMWGRTDADGRYEFLLGPGEYRIQGPARVEPANLTIPQNNPPREVVRDFAAPREDRGPFAIEVVDEAGKPLAKAIIDGAYQSMIAYFSHVTADEHGKVRIERSLDPLILVASAPDRSLAGSVRVDAEATRTTVVVKPTATASGRLVDPEGKPIPGLKLSYGIRVRLGPDRNGPFSWHFGGEATTDHDGNFQLIGLLPGETYEMYSYNESSGSFPSAQTHVKLVDTRPLALGDVIIDLSPPKPYVPPTPAQRTSESFAARKEKTPREKVEYTLVEAKREYTRPLILFGNPKDPACIDLFRLFNEPASAEGAKLKSPADLRWEFDLASLDTGQADARALAKDLGVATGSGDSPCLAVLTDDGKLAATYPLQPSADRKLAPQPLAAFLLEHKRPTRDAEAMLAEALTQAKASDRRVFLIMSASWCGPCRMLARFLVANKAELDRHYVFVKLDISRDTHAKELLERYEGKDAQNGVPWYVILDATGKPLVTSNAKDSEEEGPTNIGFPSAKTGIDHFVTMLRQTAPRLSDQVIASLRRQLEKKP